MGDNNSYFSSSGSDEEQLQKKTDSSLASKLLAEFVGTFLLVFTVGCNVLSVRITWAGTSIGCVLMVSIYTLGGVSGGNFNPAVTLSLMLVKVLGHKGGLDIKTGLMYMVSQVAAGICGAAAYYCLFWKSFPLGPARKFGWQEADITEVLYTFMLCFVVLNVAIAKDNTPNEFYGLAIGYVIVSGASGAGAISGGCFNPAVSIGIDVLSQQPSFYWGAFYVMSEFVGAILAVGFFFLVRPGDFGGKKRLFTKFVSEFLGTFFLVLTVGLNVLAKEAEGAYAIAASLMAGIYALGSVSGAHFNPAVTIAILACGRNAITIADAGVYILAQLAGAAAAAASYVVLRHGKAFALGPAAEFGMREACISEFAFTFVLAFVVLSVAVAKVTNSKTMYGLAIGACVTVGGNAIGRVSGGSLNPAVSFGVSLADLHRGGTWTNFGIYSLCEIAGGILAAMIFRLTHAVDDRGDGDDE